MPDQSDQSPTKKLMPHFFKTTVVGSKSQARAAHQNRLAPESQAQAVIQHTRSSGAER
jgi:hypothetical protein